MTSHNPNSSFLGTKPIPWSERVLPYGRTPEELPVLTERLLGTHARLMHLFLGQAPERLYNRSDDKWSVVGHAAHLLVVQHRFAARLEDFQALRPTLCTIDLSDQDEELKQHLLRNLGDLLEEFRLERLAFVQTLLDAESHVHRHVALHPCGNRPMRTVDMLLWIAEHDDHHLATMRLMLGDMPPTSRPRLWPA